MATNIKVGFHVSIAGAISNSVDNALKIGCGAFQIFSRNPRGWAAKPIGEQEAKTFRTKLASSQIEPNAVAIHMPYLPNLAAPDGEIYTKSVATFADEVERCSMLGIAYLVIHLGSHLGKGSDNGINQLVKACNYALDHYKKSLTSSSSSYSSPYEKKKKNVPVQVLLENMAGQKNSIGSKFEEIRLILDKLNSRQFGVCLDTCHAFACGYDLRKKANVEKILEHFDTTIGLKELKVVHLNDSKGALNSYADRHEHIGLGRIGKAGFVALLSHKSIRCLPLIMETPIDQDRSDHDNLKVVLDIIKASEA